MEQEEFTFLKSSEGFILTRYNGTGGEVRIPDTFEGEPVVRIATRAFWNRADVSKVQLGKSVMVIEERAFWFCTGLTALELPASVAEIGQAAFDDCVQLQNFTLEEGNPVFSCQDGVLLTHQGKTLFRCPEGKRGTYTVAAGVETIGEGAFRGCAHFLEIHLPESLLRIDNRGFLSCCQLEELRLPPHLERIGEYALTDCSHVKRLIIPASVKFIGDSAFSWTNGLEGIWFEGDAPEAHKRVIGHFVPNYPPVYYRPETSGWSAKGWCSLKTLPWKEE